MRSPDGHPVFSAAAEVDGDRVTVSVSGEVDLSTADVLFDTATRHGLKIITLDLRQVSFFDSAGVRAVIRLANRYDGGLTVMPSAQVHRVLEVSGLLDQPWVSRD